ncbi:hypothetical protein CBER1_00577 [Cercospora berteroae]|uniref:Uncharacterized protein n=1 Tax=Cercospora berteroae TaxID=357750 RepID=A0A2S6CBD1_9PEZI|nr:hypothetical protein CBER1_00577 [Cercospora berteroae]
MSGHTRKRQYQPSNQTTLNSFFGRATNARSPLSPPLDDATQSSLLSVGMRVRKSVPEGYKTHKTLGSPGFPFPSSDPSQSHSSTAPSRPSISAMNSSSNELMPFCGLHKTGGLSSQPISSAPPALDRRADDMPDLVRSPSTIASSQNSFCGTSSQDASSKKRSYEDEVESDMDAFFDEGESGDDAGLDGATNTRPLARMKSSPRKSLVTGVQIVDGDDFEEATFLVPMDVE